MAASNSRSFSSTDGEPMELRQLKHFLAVVETGSFSRAAEQLSLTPQALSKSIAALEEAVGVRLLDRTSRHVALTQYGELLHSHATTITAEAAQFTRQLDDILGVKSGRLIIGAGPTAAGSIVAPALDRLRSLQPKLKISVLGGAATTLLPMLLRGQVDVLISVMQDEIEDPLIEQQTLMMEKLVLIAGARHPLAGRVRVPLEATAESPWLVGWKPDGLDPGVEKAFRERGLTPPVNRLHTTSETFARDMLARNEYVALFPEDLFARDVQAGILTRLDVDVDTSGWVRPIKLIYRRKSTRSPAAVAFVGAIRRVLAERKGNGERVTARLVHGGDAA
jgi:DNA-binding transcriptional LysR family regulator